MQTKNKSRWLWFLLMLSIFSAVFIWKFWGKSADHIYINEVCGWNKTLLSHNEDEYYDYIELYNASAETVSLEDWYLTNDRDVSEECNLKGVTIEPKGYVIIYADGLGTEPESVDYKISPEGEKLFLIDPDKNIIDSVEVPALGGDEVYARVEDGASAWARMEASPINPNDQEKVLPKEILKEPGFSHASGFYDEPFILELVAEKDETIYYTTDGSRTTVNSSLYKNGIYIEDISDRPNVAT